MSDAVDELRRVAGIVKETQPEWSGNLFSVCEELDTLTLQPSIGFDSIGHWHGNITNGECTP